MFKKSFIIKKNEGFLFSKISGDNNKIHLDDVVGYNSIFGEKICHGCLVILKIFQIQNFRKFLINLDKFHIKIKFNKHFSYEKKIIIKSKISNKKLILELFQFNELKASILIENNNLISTNKFEKVSKKLKKKYNLINFYNKKNYMGVLSMLLCSLTKYVGTVYPGENSIINEININFNKSFNFSKNYIYIYSKKLDKRLPLILNTLIFQKYNIEFKTLERPKLNLKFNKISTQIKNKVKKIKENILIVGASSGIGFDILNILKINKKIKIFSTYNKNKIKLNQKNIKKIKVNLTKDISIIKKILSKYSPLIIYYFATPKINTILNNKHTMQLYKKFYIDYPLKIISFSGNDKIKFFYPSTIFIDKKINSNYTKVKKLGENILKKINNNNIKINICRINEVNTKQNLSLIDQNLPNFSDLLNRNKVYQKKIFFI